MRKIETTPPFSSLEHHAYTYWFDSEEEAKQAVKDHKKQIEAEGGQIDY